MSEPLRFGVLGAVEVRAGDDRVPIAGAKTQAVLAVLLLARGESVSGDQLVEALWGEDPPATARTSLHNRVSDLRKALAAAGGSDALRTVEGGYRLVVDAELVDVTRFERLVDDARNALANGDPARGRGFLGQALDLWRGLPLGGLDVPGLPVGELTALEERRDEALMLRIQADIDLHQEGEALADADRLRRERSLDERAAELAATVFARLGRPAEALTVISELRHALSEELGLEPGPAIVELEHRVLANDPSLSPPAAGSSDETAPEERRKTVTSLVARPAIGGSDPEVRRSAIRSLAEGATEEIERLGGRVLGEPVDRLVITFGLHEVKEDDAARALRTAHRLRGVSQHEDGGPAVRIGLATGEMLVEEAGGARTVRSADPIERADQLARQARRGEILIDSHTLGLTRDIVGTEPTELLLLGEEDPGIAFRVLDIAEGAPGRLHHERLVGRERELSDLVAAFDRVTRDRTPRLASVIGAAGVGKTRLLIELGDRLGSGASVLTGRCLPYGRDITLWPVAEVLRAAVGAEAPDSARAVRRRIEAFLAGSDDAEFLTNQLASVLGVEDAVLAPDELSWSIRRCLELEAARRPLVVVIDDLQWADDTLLDLLEYVVTTSRDAPMLVVGLARTELLERRPTWGGGKLSALTVALQPLDVDESELLLEGVLGGTVEPTLRDRLLTTAQGNPLFLGALVASLKADGLITSVDGRWAATAELASVPPPPSVRALLEARIDRLPPADRALIGAAAVAGNEFGDEDLLDVTPDLDTEQRRERLGHLVARDLLSIERTGGKGRTYRFHHILLRDVAELALPKASRARDHRRAGEGLIERSGERLTEVEEIVAYHLETAFHLERELGKPDAPLGRRTAAHLKAAGRRALGREDMAAAARLLGRALACLPAGDPERTELVWLRVAPLINLGRLSDANDQIADALVVAEAMGHETWRLRLTVAAEQVGWHSDPDHHDNERLTKVALDAIDRLGALGDPLGRARAFRLLGTAYFHGGRIGDALDAFRQARINAELAGDDPERAERPILATIHGRTPVDLVIEDAETYLTETPRPSPEVLRTLGLAYAMAGRRDDALDTHRQARERLTELGGELRLADALMYEGWSLLLLDEPETATEVLAASVDTLARIGERNMRPTALALLGQARFLTGDAEGAELAAQESRETAASDDPASQMTWRQVLARVLAARGESGAALALAREAVEIAEASDFLTMAGRVHLDAAEVLRSGGDLAGARVSLERARALFMEKSSVAGIAQADDRLASLGAGAVAG